MTPVCITSRSGKTRLYRSESMKFIAHLREEGVVASVSTMIGCPLSCNFCEMGKLTSAPLPADVILDQVQHIAADCAPARLRGVRFDVSDDPLFNWPAVEMAIRQIIATFDAPDILVCTAAPKSKHYDDVIALGAELPNLEFQISVHASTDAERKERFQEDRILTLREIGEIGRQWKEITTRHCSFSYMVAGLAVTQQTARQLAAQFPPAIWRPQITPTYHGGRSSFALGRSSLEPFRQILIEVGYEAVDVYLPEDALEIGAVPGLL